MAEIFTEDILIEILLRLPAKSLMRFKCVGKRWRSLISNPGFAKSHLQRLMARDSIPSQRIFKTSPFESIDYELHDGGIGGDDDLAVVKVHELRIGDPYWEPDLVGSCHGLVCLRVPGRFYLYNPTTKESRNFPCSDLVPQYELVNGFGYDPRSDDYKIVQAGGSKKWQEAIFSLKSGSWRKIQVQQESHPAYFKRGVYWNGALHWCLFELSRNKNETAIMSFDLSEEKFHRVLPVPEVDEVDGGVLYPGLGIHGANLFIYQETYNNDCIEAWITNEYRRGRSWTKWFSVSTKRIPGYTYCQTIPVTYTRSGKVVFLIDMGKMILFNPKDNTCKDYPIRRRDGYVESAIYLETLVSPYLGCGPSII